LSNTITTRTMEFYGQEVTIVGKDLQVGQQAPEFTAQAFDWSTVDVLKATAGKIRIIGSLPSLNTPVCDKETRRFNQFAQELGEEVAIAMISMDLPWTQKNWCTASRVDQVMVFSDHTNADFGIKYAVLLEEPRILRRAIFVVGKDDLIKYAQYMSALGDEPDYDAVLEAARHAQEHP
jgi:thiol peroxidase